MADMIFSVLGSHLLTFSEYSRYSVPYFSARCGSSYLLTTTWYTSMLQVKVIDENQGAPARMARLVIISALATYTGFLHNL